jgi:2-phospho-L-lactate transferase/gluconeogenesis factor (CofD/UPF0052 family)
MTQRGESDRYSASDHAKAVLNHADRKVFEYVLVNKEAPRADLLSRYQAQGAELVKPDIDKLREMGLRPVVGSFISQTDVVRHDPKKLAEAIFKLMY